jgi:hypothetical protein
VFVVQIDAVRISQQPDSGAKSPPYTASKLEKRRYKLPLEVLVDQRLGNI